MTTLDMLNWTNDVPEGSIQLFESILYKKKFKSILEIGCFRGTSLIGFLKLLPEDTLATCIDTWKNINSGELSNIDFNIIEKEFDQNILPYKNKVTKIKGDSKKILRRFIAEKTMFDLIYIDGSHTCLDTYNDLILSWMVLNNNGILIIDDYLWRSSSLDVLNIPHHAIKHFLITYKDDYIVLHIGYRVFIKKVQNSFNEDDVIIKVPNLGLFSIFKNDKISKVLQGGNIWEPWLQNIFEKVINSKKDVVDIGAYIGVHTIKLANLCFPNNVYAFEPVYYKKLKTNIKLNNLTNVIVCEKGISDTNKNTTVDWIWTTKNNKYSHENNYGCTGLNICPMGKPEWLDKLENPIPVKLVPLDDYHLDNVGFIKIDVEGLERHVIKGALNTINKCRPIITLECWKDHNGNVQDLSEPESALEDLRNLGYSVEHIHKSDFIAYPK
jgi:FkbM family methyltransferase